MKRYIVIGYCIMILGMWLKDVHPQDSNTSKALMMYGALMMVVSGVYRIYKEYRQSWK